MSQYEIKAYDIEWGKNNQNLYDHEKVRATNNVNPRFILASKTGIDFRQPIRKCSVGSQFFRTRKHVGHRL